MPDLELHGCRTTPLLSYLKALGVFRHVAKADPSARLWWHREGFAMLRSRFDDIGLVEFFIREYEPSPITSPWNGSGGYFDDDSPLAKRTIEAVEKTTDQRLHELRTAIASARRVVADLGITRKPGPGKTKLAIMTRWRSECPEAALPWLDAAVGLADQAQFNPLLGSGGNSGNLEFARMFQIALSTCLPCFEAYDERSGQRLHFALYRSGDPPLTDGSTNMFDPGTAGTPNTTSSSIDRGTANLWDWILLLEGATAFAGGTARRLGAGSGQVLFPFTTFRALRLGDSNDARSDASVRGETWLPLWYRPASLPALERLLAEGRVQDGRDQANSAGGMLRASTTLGVDRGLEGFERVIFDKRWGQTTIAVPGGRVGVRGVKSAELTRVADRWLRQIPDTETAGIRRCLSLLEHAATQLSQGLDSRSALELWLLALAETQLAVGRRPASRAASEPTHIRPLGGLDGGMVTALEDSVEHRLARALAAVGRGVGEVSLRSLVEPVESIRGWRFAWKGERSSAAISLRRPELVLITLADHGTQASVPAERRARIADVSAFLGRETDDERLVRLAYAFTLCVPCDQRGAQPPTRTRGIDRLYAATRLVTCDGIARRPGGLERDIQPSPDVIPMLAAGNGASAGRSAARRLRADGLAPARAIESIDRTPAEARRIAAALAFPLHPDDRGLLELAVLTPEPTNEDIPSPEGALA